MLDMKQLTVEEHINKKRNPPSSQPQETEKKYWIDPQKGLYFGNKFLCSIVRVEYDVMCGTFEIYYLTKTGERGRWFPTREHIWDLSAHALQKLLRSRNLRMGSHFPMSLLTKCLFHQGVSDYLPGAGTLRSKEPLVKYSKKI